MKFDIISNINDAITQRTEITIVIFIIITVLFLVGATQISTDSSTSQFTDNIPSQTALENINDKFSQRSIYTRSSGSTQIIHQKQNVLSRNSLIEMSEYEKDIEDLNSLRIQNYNTIASVVAKEIDPRINTKQQQIRVLERTSDEKLKNTIRNVIENRGFRSQVSDDYNSKSVSATSTIGTVTHNNRVGSSGGGSGPGVGESSLVDIQLKMQDIAESNSITIFGSGIQSDELAGVSQDSLTIVIPFAIFFILIFLAIAYRDPFDIILSLICLIITVIWTFGFMGYANIPFSQILVSVPPLLLAVGIDFGIHSVNRYREEIGEYSINEAMSRSNSQLLVAFGIVAGSTAIGFGSNLISPLAPIREFGIVAAIGIIFTFFTFGILLPALKIKIDEIREKYSVPEFANSPLGDEDSILGKSLLITAYISERSPYLFIFIIIIISIGMASYGSGVEAQFSNDLFLPPENLPSYIELFPVDVGEYQTPKVTNLIEDKFVGFGQSSLILYVNDDLRSDSSLEKINRISNDPPDVVIENNNRAEMTSVLTIINQTKRDPEFKRLINKNDLNNNGVPDDNLDRIYNELNKKNSEASRFITDTRGQTRIILTVKEDATNKEILEAGESIVSNSRLDITPTGGPIILREVSSFLNDTTINGLIISLILTTIYLCAIYRYMDGTIQYGIINMIPVFVTVAAVAATMRYLGITLNPITSTTLSITIGIGVDYTIHMMHRITDEIDEKDNVKTAVRQSVKGTGGALFGSMVTTVFGIGSLTLAITPLLGQFGIIISIGIFYSFLFSVLMLPSLFRIYYSINNR